MSYLWWGSEILCSSFAVKKKSIKSSPPSITTDFDLWVPKHLDNFMLRKSRMTSHEQRTKRDLKELDRKSHLTHYVGTQKFPAANFIQQCHSLCVSECNLLRMCHSCLAGNCYNVLEKGKSMPPFPHSRPDILRMFIEFVLVKRKEIPLATMVSHLCSAHFGQDDYEYNLTFEK